jgi:hypothetical protein
MTYHCDVKRASRFGMYLPLRRPWPRWMVTTPSRWCRVGQSRRWAGVESKVEGFRKERHEKRWLGAARTLRLMPRICPSALLLFGATERFSTILRARYIIPYGGTPKIAARVDGDGR